MFNSDNNFGTNTFKSSDMNSRYTKSGENYGSIN